MSKITFRADDDLVEQLEEFDASKSEVLREALREYLDEDRGRPNASSDPSPSSDQASELSDDEASDAGSLDALVARRVDELVEERLDAVLDERIAAARAAAGRPQDVNVDVTVEGAGVRESAERKTRSRAPEPDAERGADAAPEPAESERACSQCGETVDDEHVYCPNCGEKASRRAFCECGDEVRSDWAFCPGCGRRTPAADVLDPS